MVDNGGKGYPSCGAVNQALYQASQPLFKMLPEISTAIRNDKYKLVENTMQTYDPATDTIGTTVTEELYEINQEKPVPLLDTADRNLLPAATPEIRAVYDDLRAKLDRMLASEPDCPGDGNRDGVVNAEDLANWGRIAKEWGLSSVYDFMVDNVFDGLTNTVDGNIVQNNLGKPCGNSYGIY